MPPGLRREHGNLSGKSWNRDLVFVKVLDLVAFSQAFRAELAVAFFKLPAAYSSHLHLNLRDSCRLRLLGVVARTARKLHLAAVTQRLSTSI